MPRILTVENVGHPRERLHAEVATGVHVLRVRRVAGGLVFSHDVILGFAHGFLHGGEFTLGLFFFF